LVFWFFSFLVLLAGMLMAGSLLRAKILSGGLLFTVLKVSF